VELLAPGCELELQGLGPRSALPLLRGQRWLGQRGRELSQGSSLQTAAARKAGMAVSLWSHLVSQRAGGTRETVKCLLESQPNFSSVLCYMSAERLLPRLSSQETWSCNAPGLISVLLPQVSSSWEHGARRVRVSPCFSPQQETGTSHEAHQEPREQLRVPWF